MGQSNYIQKGSFFLQDHLATEYEYDENGNSGLLRRQSDELFSSWMDAWTTATSPARTC